ncbi:MAG: methyltransferase domain-containing protein [Alphaproteobacteria bacterium]
MGRQYTQAKTTKGKSKVTARQWYEAGQAHMRHKDLKQAFMCFKKACSQDKNTPQYHDAFGKLALKLGQYRYAFDAFYHLCKTIPNESNTYISLLSQACNGLKIDKFDLQTKGGLLLCLQSDIIDHQRLAPLWFDLLRRDKKCKHLFDKTPVSLSVKDQYILTGLTRFFTVTADMELWLTNLRRATLHALTQDNDDAIPLAASIAQHCFLNEYVFATDENEENILHTLESAISSGQYSEQDLIAFAMYRPLHTFHDVKAITKSHQTELLYAIIKQHIIDRSTEENHKNSIPAYGTIEEKTSQNVRGMYEENPYPRWQNINAVSTPISCDAISYLIAGCGTGRSACQTSAILPDTPITAVDLSLTSLSYAKRKAQEFNLQNISFRQGDILSISELEQKFDVIECSGVLHHMKDPIKGWRALLNVLNTGGIMNIGLYSRKARKHIIDAQNYAKEQGYKDTLSDIKEFRANIFALPDDHPLRPILNHNDFYTTSNCRDLIFHRQETCYDLDEITHMLDQLDMVCAGVSPATPAIASLYRDEFRNDPDMCNLNNWNKLEEAYPQICMGMYQFTCVRENEKATLNDQVKLLQRSRLF